MIRNNTSEQKTGKTGRVSKAALGLRAHSGWSALVVVTGTASLPRVIDRRRIELIDSTILGAAQPYHAAEEMPLKEAEKYISRCVARTRLLARQAIGSVIEKMRRNDVDIVGCGFLLSSAKPLPVLEGILASHPLIHTAEGVFFRDAIADASEHHGLPIIKVKERELYSVVTARFGLTEEELQKRISDLGRELGPPWRQDEKFSTIVGLLALASTSK